MGDGSIMITDDDDYVNEFGGRCVVIYTLILNKGNLIGK